MDTMQLNFLHEICQQNRCKTACALPLGLSTIDSVLAVKNELSAAVLQRCSALQCAAVASYHTEASLCGDFEVKDQ
ncbi:hypothetical protein HPP92_005955 [Vanilla planifolia]|uniref:Uncharacterized protein n=1 Tax=Vanilla planifolia TaxID=51239 RepID=A0A835RVH1_VANPL|nr:hypothetical protein HPP92_005955 [Vanilla planifolia]